jgi:hypothetical protein
LSKDVWFNVVGEATVRLGVNIGDRGGAPAEELRGDTRGDVFTPTPPLVL